MRMSTRPNSESALAAIASTWSFLPTSATIEIALTPRAWASRATASASAWVVRGFTTPGAPPPASFRTVVRPMFRPEPVTSATFPSSLPMRHPLAVRNLYHAQEVDGRELFLPGATAEVGREPLEDVTEPLDAGARPARARHLVVLARKPREADLTPELLEGDEELLGLLDRAAQIVLGVQDQKRGHDVLGVREGRALDVARHVLPWHRPAELDHAAGRGDG